MYGDDPQDDFEYGADEKKIIDLSTHMEKKKKALGKKRMFSAKTMLSIFVLVLAVSAILLSPLFSVKNINIEGLSKYSEAEFLNKIGIGMDDNIFIFRKSSINDLITSNPYFESISTSISLPDTINITVKERKVRGYVPFMGSYLYIDEYGLVLDIQTYFSDNLPIVYGLEFDNFQLGEFLSVNNTESFDVIVKISQLTVKYNIIESVIRVDVSNPKDIRLYVNNIEVLLGNVNDGDEKISLLSEAIKQIPEEDRGILDLSDLDKPIIFKYLT